MAVLQDYGTLVAPIAAIINGLIAVLVAQFFKDHPIAKVLLVVAAGVLGAAAIAATFYTQHEIVAARKAEAQRHKEIRDQLGKFISEGLALVENCGDSTKPPPWAQADKWVAEVVKFLNDRMGSSYAQRLRSPSGIPVNTVCRNADDEHNKLYHMVYAVNFRLDEFSHEGFN